MLKFIIKNKNMLRIVMKIITILFTVLLISNLSLYATGTCTDKPITENISARGITQPAGATKIDELKGKNCDGESLFSFKIKTLPLAVEGILSLSNGTAITVGQLLTEVEAKNLRFDPATGFVGNASFTYSAIDERTGEGTNATVIIPVIAGNAGNCNEAPRTDDKRNNNLSNTMDAVNILNLSGVDCTGVAVEKFKIKSLPNANAGVLYMADGVTAVRVNEILTKEQADGLKFDPAAGFVGNASFTYAAIDNGNKEDATPATFTIPVIGGNGGDRPGGGNCNEAPRTDDKRNNNLSNTMDAVNILNLSGVDCTGVAVEKFKITSLPNANTGVLYMADGVTPVTVGQILTKEEADGLKFDPVAGFVGNASFTYAAIDNQDREDATPATVTLPVVAARNGVVCTEAPTTDDINNPNLTHNLPAVNILNLDGKDCEGEDVENFRIVTLPNANAGVLYMADGVTAVTVGQILTRAEANGLRFDPKDNFVGDVDFTYVAIDENGRVDETPAIVTMTVIHPDNDENCTCEDYETSVPASTPFGLMIMALLTLFIVRKSLKKEI